MILAIIQARMSSSRLPGKVLKPILGRPMLGHHMDRLKRSKRIDKIVLATSTESSDDLIGAFGSTEDVAIYRGSLNDVLDRFFGAYEAHGPADHIVRLTADCPMADWRVIDECIDLHLSSGADCTSNTMERTYPDGLDVEVLKAAALEKMHQLATLPYDREHVTPYIYRHPEVFAVQHLRQAENLEALRWTVDTPADFEMVSAVFAALLDKNPDFGQQDVLDLLKSRPDIEAINAPA